MINYQKLLRSLRRPKLLIRAAKIGAVKYSRKRHLKMVNCAPTNGNQDALFSELLEKERDIEWIRQSGSADYNVHKHIILLSAIIAEARAAISPAKSI